MQMLSEMRILKKRVMTFLGSFRLHKQLLQALRSGGTPSFSSTHIITFVILPLSKADDPKLALLCIKFGIVNFTFMFFSFKKEKIYHAQVCQKNEEPVTEQRGI